jgi:hypothetical protein
MAERVEYAPGTGPGKPLHDWDRDALALINRGDALLPDTPEDR